MTIGDRIEERLADLHWTQSQLARATGLSQTTINSMIRRGARMTPHLGRIATALHTTTAYLTGEVDDPNADMPDVPALSAEEARWLGLFKALDTRSRGALIQIAETMITGMNHPTISMPRKSTDIDKGK